MLFFCLSNFSSLFFQFQFHFSHFYCAIAQNEKEQNRKCLKQLEKQHKNST
jgi:hypothetical protein